jgi:hypothetical protein
MSHIGQIQMICHTHQNHWTGWIVTQPKSVVEDSVLKDDSSVDWWLKACRSQPDGTPSDAKELALQQLADAGGTPL